MSSPIRRIATLAVMLLATAGGAAASAHSGTRSMMHPGPLTGEWSGHIGSGSSRQPMTIAINARETRGTWRISARCYGTLTLDSISGGYHHFRRHAAAGAGCAGGDVDCLKRYGAELYDAITSHLGGSWDSSGTFRRVRA
jgi:hypothetical protein